MPELLPPFEEGEGELSPSSLKPVGEDSVESGAGFHQLPCADQPLPPLALIVESATLPSVFLCFLAKTLSTTVPIA
jgi:hypothetical protein